MYVDTFSLDVSTRAPTGQTNAYLVSGEPVVGDTDAGPRSDDTDHEPPSDDADAESGTAERADTDPETETLLIDPAARSETLDTVVHEKGLDHVAVTHTHPDHVDAVAHYATTTDATVWARRWRTDRFREATGVDPDRTFLDGDAVGPARVSDTPGHAPDHVAFETARGVVCGDLAVATGSVAVAAPEGDVRAYLASLRRLLARDPPRLYPGHGPVIDDPRGTCERLLAHRRDRERAVREAVAGGARDLESVVDDAYETDVSGVRDLARATVVAHLEKLAAEGHLRWDPTTERVSPVT
ncbi:MBL fold metallo-hydrolase [Halobaculum sp. MBLA0147]|uniref:MBL fold metallo-hydrolase n=1 Tax=Halobaculum sp. MBLA0147 TaxID=3079934 RepID=UPI003523F6C8